MKYRVKSETDARYQKTEQKLLKTILFLKQSYSLKIPKITEICRLAKISTSTFYRHYSSLANFFEINKNKIILDFCQSETVFLNKLPDIQPRLQSRKKLVFVVRFLYRNRATLGILAKEEILAVFAEINRFLRGQKVLVFLLYYLFDEWEKLKFNYAYFRRNCAILQKSLVVRF